LEAQGKLVTLLATDLEVGIRVELDKMDIQEPGAGLVSADRLHAILRELQDDTISLSSTAEETKIVVPGSHFTILGNDPNDFPAVPEFPASGAFTVAADDLLALVERTLFATAKENTRYALNGVLWEVEGNNLTMVSTDGRRLSLARGKCKDGPKEKASAIVPSKAMQLIQRCLTDAEKKIHGDVKVVLREKDILLEAPPSDGGRRIICSRLVDGHFPKYEDVIPKDVGNKATLKAEAFLAAVRKAALLTNEESRGVMLKLSKEEIVVSSHTPEMGEAEVRMPAAYDGEPLEIGFNPVYLIDAIKVIDAEEFVFGFKGPSKPGVITEGRLFTHVVMPVSIV
jgi:DNA polymerase-3 subunit beta